MLKTGNLSSFTSPKILSLEKMQGKIAAWKEKGNTVGLCHGGFDLLHPGHVKHFESTKKLCDKLVVSVTSDRFVAGRKGSGRPVFTESLRAYALAALHIVDAVVITDFERGVAVIETLKPSFYIKGPDFIGKTTPGITAEREAIAGVGGEMKYTEDLKLATTEIISYIQKDMERKKLLLIMDRDGTLIHNDNFFGRFENWREELALHEEVLGYVASLQQGYATTSVVVTNQAGIARGYFTPERVEEIHAHLHSQFLLRGVVIHNWQYCKEVDAAYAETKKDELAFVSAYVKERTKRKPHPDMVLDALQQLGKKKEDFDAVVVVGNSEEDRGLAENLQARFVDVKGKGCEELKKEFW